MSKRLSEECLRLREYAILYEVQVGADDAATGRMASSPDTGGGCVWIVGLERALGMRPSKAGRLVDEQHVEKGKGEQKIRHSGRPRRRGERAR